MGIGVVRRLGRQITQERKTLWYVVDKELQPVPLLNEEKH